MPSPLFWQAKHNWVTFRLREDVAELRTIRNDEEKTVIRTILRRVWHWTRSEKMQSSVVSSASKTILAEVVQAWQAGFDPLSPIEISTSLISLQTDNVRRAAMAKALLYIIANETPSG